MKFKLVHLFIGVVFFTRFTSTGLAIQRPEFNTVITTNANPNASNSVGLTEFRSSNGLLAVDISATYDSNNPNGAVFPTPGDGSMPPFYRLAYSCKYTGSISNPIVSYGGPFLRVQPGDHVVINFQNRLNVERTNLHFHGLGITPKLGTSQGLDYGDYVGLPYVNFVAPSTTRQFDFYIPKEQRQGLYWYHSHAHSVSEYQVGTGLSGPILIEGELNRFVNNLTNSMNLTNPTSQTKETAAKIAQSLPTLPYYVLTLKGFVYPGDTNGIVGPFEQTVNGNVTYTANNPGASTPFWITSGGTKQVWSIANIDADTYYNLIFQVSSNNVTTNLPFQVLTLDCGLISPRNAVTPSQTNLFIPPGGRATVIVPTDLLGTNIAKVIALPVTTSLGSQPSFTSSSGDSYFQPTNSPTASGDGRSSVWDLIEVHPTNTTVVTSSNQMPPLDSLGGGLPTNNYSYLSGRDIQATYVFSQPWLYYTNSNELPLENLGVLTFYKYVPAANGGPNNVKNPVSPYDYYEPAIATLVPGVPQNWIIQNTTQEWHVFHFHQVHFVVDHFTSIPFPYDPAADPTLNTQRPTNNFQHPFYASNQPPPPGKQNGDPIYSGSQDTLSIPPMTQAWIRIPMTEGTHKDDSIAGLAVMHCHILNHEDAGMMANMTITEKGGREPKHDQVIAPEAFTHSLPARELPVVLSDRPLNLEDASGRTHSASDLTKTDYSLVTFGFTHCDGTCPITLEKCVEALSKLTPGDRAKISPFFISLDPKRDRGGVLSAYAKRKRLPREWSVLADSDQSGTRAFGVRVRVKHLANGDRQIWHSSVVYLIDRNMNIRAAFDPQDSTDFMVSQLKKLLSQNSLQLLDQKTLSKKSSSSQEMPLLTINH
jgi:FtsP/CotA-like multicopper oxidase with cupredoxin domain/cytochrome oxidase Cu insertion factor (SCO1/SenC/PrrC family)